MNQQRAALYRERGPLVIVSSLPRKCYCHNQLSHSKFRIPAAKYALVTATDLLAFWTMLINSLSSLSTDGHLSSQFASYSTNKPFAIPSIRIVGVPEHRAESWVESRKKNH